MYYLISFLLLLEVTFQLLKRFSYNFSMSGDSGAFVSVLFIYSFIVSLFFVYAAGRSLSIRQLFATVIKSPLPFGLLALSIGLLENVNAAVILFLQSYYWLFVFSFCLSVWGRQSREYVSSNLITGRLTCKYIFLLVMTFSVVISVIQYVTTYSFEREWFEHSNTTLSYAGLTNFGTSIRLIGPFSGMIDFGFFVLFSMAYLRFNFIGMASVIVVLVGIGSKAILLSSIISAFLSQLTFLWKRHFVYLGVAATVPIFYYLYNNFLNDIWSIKNGYLSIATLAPRLEMWASALTDVSLLGQLGVNLSQGNALRPLDSSFLFLATDCGLLFTIIFTAQIINFILHCYHSGYIYIAVVALVFVLAMFTQVNALMRFTLLIFCFLISPWGYSNGTASNPRQ